MKITHDLSALDWHVSGWHPHQWRFHQSMETGAASLADILPVPARVPGSVQGALRDAGVLPDWNIGLNARACEWVEHRHWIYEAALPDDWLSVGKSVHLSALGLDYAGWVLVNGHEAGAFMGTFTPHLFDLTPHLSAGGPNRLALVFDCPPRWLGQFGYTSQMTDWKPRFNYTWDWTSRLVQTGIWDALVVEVWDGPVLGDLRVGTEMDADGWVGRLSVSGVAAGADGVRVRLSAADGSNAADGEALWAETFTAEAFAAGLNWDDLPVEPWQVNGRGVQPLYTVQVEIVGADGFVHDTATRRVGFKHVEWRQNSGAPTGADPWLCVVNGEPLFLQGVNWTPIRPNFADVSEGEYRQRLTLYRDLGFNLMRVWGGAFLETEAFYGLCDELGLLVWQEFPLSSSGIENWPPEDEPSLRELVKIARSYITRRRHHVSLLLWCGGNELQGSLDGSKTGIGLPVTLSHPLMTLWNGLVASEDPGRRFIATSSLGPRFSADPADFGKGLHWDVHGPWQSSGTDEDWAHYWANDDALFRSETGAPGASGTDITLAYSGDYNPIPATLDNPLWRRTSWWIEWPLFVREQGREPRDLEEYVSWSQARQAHLLSVAARASKARFPACGGFILWMGHDCFPCAANTAIVDFWGRPKPAALALGQIFREPSVSWVANP